MDMLILPPESCVQVDSRLALYELLQILRRRVRFCCLRFGQTRRALAEVSTVGIGLP